MTSATSRTFGSRPKPNQITASGATAMIGSVCEAMSSGSSARRTAADASIATEQTNPTAIASANPSVAARSVASPFSTRSARFSHVASATADGAGSTSGPIALTVTYSSHPESSSATTAAGASSRLTCRRLRSGRW